MIRPGILAAALAAGGLIGACSAAAPATPSQDPLASVHVTPTVGGTALVATGAFADFGVNGGGARQVKVRIVDSMDLRLSVESSAELTLAEAPLVCLVGPYSAPDDAGLESPCWGQPELSTVLTSMLAQDPAGHYVLPANQAVDVDVTLSRGTQRCDYPPGEWQVELKLNLLGSSEGGRYVADTRFDVPITILARCGCYQRPRRATAAWRRRSSSSRVSPR